ncbi:surfeit locus protein 1 [Sitophilus oryzae]|uniref:SURF1-like protein n=1 Tax=Sitophilus oryzae TaxID=7048 RepID=A0A6J2YHP2_SITOR|nr:surfeit locus protein 1 [Sitophilus oryzae]
MNKLFSSLRLIRAHCVKSQLVFVSHNCNLNQISKPAVRKTTVKYDKIEPLGWFLLIIPCSAFGLGVWQVQRKAWKENLIQNLKTQTNSDPIRLPDNLEELSQLEYNPIHVRGKFLHDKEIYLGPRSLLSKGEATSQSSLITTGGSNSQGYLVVTPFKLEDRDMTILVNRGWVPAKKIDPKTRPNGQVEDTVDVIGVLRLHEPRPTFVTKNQSGTKLYFYRDLPTMCAATGAAPVFLDQTDECNAKGGPIGGQTRISLRNEHLSYILTWFTLCGATSYMWFKKFVVK